MCFKLAQKETSMFKTVAKQAHLFFPVGNFFNTFIQSLEISY